MREERFSEINSLSFLSLVKSENLGLGVKKYIYRIYETVYSLELLAYKGDNFYSYNPELLKITKPEFTSRGIVSPIIIESSIEDVMLGVPYSIQKDIMFNINLFI